jgi:hypothetical protein
VVVVVGPPLRFVMMVGGEVQESQTLALADSPSLK